MRNNLHKEVECRFLEINKDALVTKLLELGAEDLGEKVLEETIVYDKEGNWKTEGRFIRIRKIGEEVELTYKEHRASKIDGAYEINIKVEDYKKAELIFEHIGLVPWRHQKKLRYTLKLDGVTLDIDTWPNVPPYVELESDSEEKIKAVATKIGYDWNNAEFHNAGWILENKYNIKIKDLKWFTFDRTE